MNGFEFVIAFVSIVGPLYYLHCNSPERKNAASDVERKRMQKKYTDLQIRLIHQAHCLCESGYHKDQYLSNMTFLNLKRQLHDLELEAMAKEIRLVDVPGIEITK